MARRQGNSNEPLLIGKTHVYIRSNFERIDTEDGTHLFEYDEEIIPIEEYLKREEINNLQDVLDTVMGEILPPQVEQLEEVSDTVDTILTEILPHIMGLDE